MACSKRELRIPRLSDHSVVFQRKAPDANGDLKGVDCTGWSVSAKIIKKDDTEVVVQALFADESIGMVRLDIAAGSILEGDRGAELMVAWTDTENKVKTTILNIVTC